MLAQKDSTRAAQLANKFFEAFPSFNFPYDAGVVPFLNVLVGAGDYENAKKHVRILAQETKAFGDFLLSLDAHDLVSFGQDLDLYGQCASDVKDLAKKTGDAAFEKEMNDLIGDLDAKLAALNQSLRHAQ